MSNGTAASRTLGEIAGGSVGAGRRGFVGAGRGAAGCAWTGAAARLALFARSGVVGVLADRGLDVDAGVLGLGFDLDLD